MKAWHFLSADCKTRFHPQILVEVGQTLTVDPQRLEFCKYGLHASERIIDAFQYAPGPILCRVELGGLILRDIDKVCAERRTVLAMADASTVLHEFACQCAESVLHLIPDEQQAIARRAIDTKRAWVKGQASDSELVAARNAARDATRDTARNAATSIAWYAAHHAAVDAARAAARDAWFIGGATSASQNEQLTAMARELLNLKEDE